MNRDSAARTIVVGRKISVTTAIDRQWWSRSIVSQPQQPLHVRCKPLAQNVIDLRSYFKHKPALPTS